MRVAQFSVRFTVTFVAPPDGQENNWRTDWNSFRSTQNTSDWIQ